MKAAKISIRIKRNSFTYFQLDWGAANDQGGSDFSKSSQIGGC